MNKADLEKRTKRFAVKIIGFVATLPQTRTCAVIEYQIVKAGTSIGANYREANRAESRNDFIHKIAIVEKESSESRYWLEICDEAHLGDAEQRSWLLQEAGEKSAIFTSSGRTAKAGLEKDRNFGLRIANCGFPIVHRPIDRLLSLIENLRQWLCKWHGLREAVKFEVRNPQSEILQAMVV